ncbi:unnamed protein product [Fraxinus pennsylvanica]|uniref:Protein kinase domain-containing protein n=1 Tax=Fraxinus pennsylvanica TaxID=56036 RepID=A0AAD2EBJ4_9LAMI|nr:unnamed protein product [Fraxinus pennsylvanica]
METPTFLLVTLLLVLYAERARAAIRCGYCGKTLVAYPLSTRPDCGDQDYKVRCIASSLWFESMSGAHYLITSINPQAQRMIIQPPSVYPGTCLSQDFQSQGIQLDDSRPFNITASNTILLLNCTDNMLHLQVPINCSSNCLCHTYINSTPVAAACNRVTLCCSFRTGGSQNAYIIRVHPNGCMAYQSYVNLDSSLSFAKWPAPGLELMWATPPEPICKTQIDCRDLPFSKCSPDPADGRQKRCFWKKGRYWDPATGYCRKCRHGTGCKYHKNKTPVIGSVAGVFLLVALSGFLIFRQRRYTKRAARNVLIKEREEILNANSSGKSTKIFTGKDIKKATNDFSKENLLGSGGFGEVFKGTLEDGTDIAVKRAKPGNAKANYQVLNEVRILCQVNHRNLVALIGCCVELEQPLLIYEYISNGTLFDHLHGFHLRQWPPLNWLSRLTIAQQAADGLAQLHSSAVPPIYHRDVKTTIDFNREEENVNLVVYMKRIMDEEKLLDAVDPVLKEGASKVGLETMKAIGNLAAACLDERRQNRPSMKEVAEEIKYVISIVTGRPQDRLGIVAIAD